MTVEPRYLLDTNVLSELNKPRPNGNVVKFLQDLPPSRAFLSVLTLGELRKGVAIRSRRVGEASVQALAVWIDELEEAYRDRLLPVDLQIARIWGELAASRSRPVIDTLLAATAMHYNLILATRNVRDVEDTPVVLHNPWLAL